MSDQPSLSPEARAVLEEAARADHADELAARRMMNDPRVGAAVDMVRRTGAETFQIRYQDDEDPVVWLAVAGYEGERWEAAAAMNPLRAVLRLCERLIDGALCVHCNRPAGFEADDVEAQHEVFDQIVCWYQFEPELATFRRGCEGDTPAPEPAAADG